MMDAVRDAITAPRRSDTLPETTLDADTLGLLARNFRRRRAIEYIDREGAVSLGDLADHVALEEFDEALEHHERQRVYIDFYQNHIDLLADAGVIHYQEQDKRIIPGPNLDAVRVAGEMLEVLGGGDDA